MFFPPLCVVDKDVNDDVSISIMSVPFRMVGDITVSVIVFNTVGSMVVGLISTFIVELCRAAAVGFFVKVCEWTDAELIFGDGSSSIEKVKQ